MGPLRPATSIMTDMRVGERTLVQGATGWTLFQPGADNDLMSHDANLMIVYHCLNRLVKACGDMSESPVVEKSRRISLKMLVPLILVVSLVTTVAAASFLTANVVIPSPTGTVNISGATLSDITSSTQFNCNTSPGTSPHTEKIDCSTASFSSGDTLALSLQFDNKNPNLTSGTVTLSTNDPGISFQTASATTPGVTGGCSNPTPTNTCTTIISSGTVVSFTFGDNSISGTGSTLLVDVSSP